MKTLSKAIAFADNQLAAVHTKPRALSKLLISEYMQDSLVMDSFQSGMLSTQVQAPSTVKGVLLEYCHSVAKQHQLYQNAGYGMSPKSASIAVAQVMQAATRLEAALWTHFAAVPARRNNLLIGYSPEHRLCQVPNGRHMNLTFML